MSVVVDVVADSVGPSFFHTMVVVVVVGAATKRTEIRIETLELAIYPVSNVVIVIVVFAQQGCEPHLPHGSRLLPSTPTRE
ncbi:hypothetical protein K435DRAFT_852599 [Dendrothele bispora CBS 962.96]|uniref:Uncharacterized protein n=1 Tax=Dendrothele bispora (strain CBS 962.96) TaxID=1314807 RepID=A0A4S8MJX7_DENBC|nr:hypothetical protein K435DRAFT_852599 [Dendrothele bispora CBS 962.96]